MRIVYILFIFLIGIFFMDCSQKENSNQPEITIRSVTFINSTEEVDGPPDDLRSTFKSLQEWLFSVCDNEKPLKAITTYNLGVTESAGNYTLYLVGLNDYDVEENHSATRIDFEPSDMYFPLPKSEYKNLDRDQVMEKVKVQWKEFTNSEKFKTSFLSQAKSINIAGHEIWSK